MKQEIIKLRLQGCNYKEIATILGCAKSTISYHCKSLNIPWKTTDEKIAEATRLYTELGSIVEVAARTGLAAQTVSKLVGGATLTKKADKTVIPKVESLLTRKEQVVRNVIAWRKRKKIDAVAYKGGKCSICSYDKCIAALEFHHLDPTQKDFGISKDGTTRSWELIKAELDKCILVCANCHREIHNKLQLENEQA